MILHGTIEHERDAIRNEGVALEREKDVALDANVAPANDYDIRLLRLIRRIIAHDRAHRNTLIPAHRKSNLCNIVKSVQLLNDTPRHYNSTVNGYMNANMWSDFAYLSKFKISNPDPRLIQPHDINDAEIVALLDGQCIAILDRLCEVEILAYPPNGLGPTQAQAVSAVARDQNRTQYRDHRNNQQLYIMVAYHREIEQLNKSIEAMQFAEGVTLGAGVAEPESTIHKITVLRAFVVLGEAATQKNLTPHTKALAPGLTDNDWQLFINIRNKLAHTEWDIHRRALDGYLRQNDFIALQAELPYIRNQYEQAKLALVNSYNARALQAHYTTPAIASVAAANLLINARALNTALPAANQDFQNHPASFTPVMMVDKIQIEVASLAAELVVCPLAALDDIHNEDTHLIIEPSATWIIENLRHVNRNRSDGTTESMPFDSNLNDILAHFTNRQEPLQLELPRGLFLAIGALSRTGNSNAASVQINLMALRAHFHANFDQYIVAIGQYKRSLDFINFLKDRPTLSCICQHRIGRIGKFLSRIDANVLDPLIGNMQRREITALRNLVQHGDDTIDILNIPIEAFLLHYLQPIMRRLVPTINPLLIHGPGVGPVIPAAPDPHAQSSFLERNGQTILKCAVFAAGTFFVLYKIFSQKNSSFNEVCPVLPELASNIPKNKPTL